MALGRGLGSLIPSKTNAQAQPAARERTERTRTSSTTSLAALVHEIPVGDILDNPLQPRTTFHHQAQEELIASIQKHGILQPLVVTPKGEKYQLIAGERRLRSAKILRMKTIPAIVRNATEQEQLELSIIENIQRKNLNPLEEGYAFRRLIDEFELTQDEVAKQVSKSRAYVANALRLLNLPDPIQKALREETLTPGHAKAILALPSEKEQLALYETIASSRLSVRETEQRVSQKKPTARGREAMMLKDIADRLQEFFGTKVAISKSGSRGSVQITYYSIEELSAIVKKILR